MKEELETASKKSWKSVKTGGVYKFNKKNQTPEEKAYDLLREKQIKYLKENRELLYKNCFKLVKRIYRNRKQREEYESVITGLILRLCIFLNGKLTFPKDFPKKLINIGLLLTKKILKDLSLNKLGWKEPNKRKKGLELQLKIFSKK